MTKNTALDKFPAKHSFSIFTVLILFLASCEALGSKDYQYIETSMHTDLRTTAPKERKPLLIAAKTDSAAYVQADINFCVAKHAFNYEFKKSGARAGQPISFKLLNEKSIDITNAVSFLNKEKIKRNIERRVSLLDLSKEQ